MTDILIVEDNKEIQNLLKMFLEAEGYKVAQCFSGDLALQMFEELKPKLVLLDVMLPALDGFAICKKIRETSNTPIFITSAKIQKDDKLQGLISGADAYIEKPFDIDILIAQIKGVFKRKYNNDSIVVDNLRLEKVNKQCFLNGSLLSLTSKEFELLLLLVENKGKVLNKEYIFDQIWGAYSYSEAQTLTVHIKWLREKIESDPKNPKHILTAWGVGYRFE